MTDAIPSRVLPLVGLAVIVVGIVETRLDLVALGCVAIGVRAVADFLRLADRHAADRPGRSEDTL